MFERMVSKEKSFVKSRSSSSEVFYKEGILQNVARYTGKHRKNTEEIHRKPEVSF